MSDLRPCQACGANVGGFHYSPNALRRTWLCDACTASRKPGESVAGLRDRLVAAGGVFPGLPKGYRFADDLEAEYHDSIPGAILVSRLYDTTGKPYPASAADVAVPKDFSLGVWHRNKQQA